jgi:hypothetical protein
MAIVVAARRSASIGSSSLSLGNASGVGAVAGQAGRTPPDRACSGAIRGIAEVPP